MPYNSLYVHVPFCRGGKCDYCAFYSVGNGTPELIQRYLTRLEEELAKNAHRCAPLRSIFIGGGTPGALPPEALQQLINIIRRHTTLVTDCEWSLEANPDSLSEESIAIAAAGGVNRISLGIQSFSPQLRQRIGRRGSLERLPQVIKAIRNHGISRLNLDLIWGIPGQSPEEWRQELQQALEYQPQHLSCYNLIVEEDTPLGKRLADYHTGDDTFIPCWEITDQILASAGLHRYEISNFAQPNCQCRHNQEIWHGQSYLGCGPAAVSFDGVDRPANPSSLEDWLNHAPPQHDIIPPEQRRREIYAFAMRTLQGWSWPELQERTGLTREMLNHDAPTQALHRTQMVVIDDIGIRPTPKGLLYNDDLLEALL